MCIKVVGQIQKSCLREKARSHNSGAKVLVVRLGVGLGDSISYLLLHNKLPQNLVAKGNTFFAHKSAHWAGLSEISSVLCDVRRGCSTGDWQVHFQSGSLRWLAGWCWLSAKSSAMALGSTPQAT